MESCVEGMESVRRKDAWNFWGSRSKLLHLYHWNPGRGRVDDPQFMPDNLEEKKRELIYKASIFFVGYSQPLDIAWRSFFDRQQLAPAGRHKGRQKKN